VEKLSTFATHCRNSSHRNPPLPADPRVFGGEVNSLIEYLSRLFADLKEESGQTMAEYAVVLGVLSNKISSVLNGVIGAM
jgi:Flp pilus assembly pilin Flp